MADQKQLRRLRKDVYTWNEWRKAHPDIMVDLSGAHLSETYLLSADLDGVDLSGAHLDGADLSVAGLNGANLRGADLSGADLSGAYLGRADLSEADLSGAQLDNASLIETHLRGADLSRARLNSADLSGADLSEANLTQAHLIEARLIKAQLRGANLNQALLSKTDLSGANLNQASLRGAFLIEARLNGADLSEADLSGAQLRAANMERAVLLNTLLKGADLTACRVYGVSAWGIHLEGAKQTNLVITPTGEPAITVDNLEVAQFIYLLLNNKRIREVIDTITSKLVLILGRFTTERKVILDALRDTLRARNYLPVVFDFDKPASRDLTETVSTLAHLARFIIADITDPKSIPQELQAIVPDLAVPVQPIIARPQQPWGMFIDFPKKYHWVLETHGYTDLNDLLGDLQTNVIAPAEAKAKQLAAR